MMREKRTWRRNTNERERERDAVVMVILWIQVNLTLHFKHLLSRYVLLLPHPSFLTFLFFLLKCGFKRKTIKIHNMKLTIFKCTVQ